MIAVSLGTALFSVLASLPNRTEAPERTLGRIQSAFRSGTRSLPTERAAQWAAALDLAAESIAPVTPFPGYEPSFNNDNPLDGANVLGTEHEALAFARLIVSPRVTPPLSIGIFGDWGSGKSFFMNRIHRHVSAASPAAPRTSSTDATDADRIIQIRFNAWHYMESNLWASLVEFIFGELEEGLRPKQAGSATGTDLLERLSTAQQLKLEAAETLGVARKATSEALSALAEAQKDLREKLLETAPPSAGELVTMAWKHVHGHMSPAAKRELDEIAGDLHLPALRDSASALRDAAEAAHDQQRRLTLHLGTILRGLGTPAGFALVALALLLPPLILALFAWIRGTPLLTSAGELAAWASLTMTSLSFVISRAVAMSSRGVRLLQGIADTVEKRRQTLATDERKKADDAAKDLADRTAAVARAEAALADADRRQQEAQREFDEGTARGRLFRFIRDRVASGTYARHLGVVATIRKDFGELSRLLLATESESSLRDEVKRLREQFRRRLDALKQKYGEHLSKELKELEQTAEATMPEVAGLRRMVLYIDDLDRCPASKVVEVLQAVHLLLSFPLFVVVVAVDARWLARSLEQQYPNLLAPRSSNGSPGPGDAAEPTAAEPHDYLEKIFQLAYWVRPMDETSSVDYIRHRISDDLRDELDADRDPANAMSIEDRDEATARGANDEPRSTPDGLSDQTTPSDQTASSNQASSSHQTGANDRPADNAGEPSADAVEAEPKPAHEPEAPPPAPLLRLSAREAELMEMLAPHLGGSPRRALRFVNTYRVVKSGLAAGDQTELSDAEADALLIQLALVCGAPRCAGPLFRSLAARKPDLTVADLRTSLPRMDGATAAERASLDAILGIAEGRAAESSSGLTIRELKAAATIARRYAFLDHR